MTGETPLNFRSKSDPEKAPPQEGEVSGVGMPDGAGALSDHGKAYAGLLAGKQEDLVLAAKGGGLEIYDKVLQDAQVFSTFQQRRLALLAKDVEVQPGANDKASEMAADFIREQICSLSFDDICNKMLYGVFYGYAVAECLWMRDGRHWGLDNIKVRKAARFKYDAAGQLRLKTLGKPQGEIMPARKFWTFESGASHHDNPRGLGVASYLYWPVYFKRNGLRYWLLALEKFGAPTAVGKYPSNASAAEKAKLLEAVAAFASVSGLTIPEGMSIDLLTAGAKVGGNHDKLIDVMDEAISKVVLSQTMTTDNGSSNSQAQVHENVLELIVKADADLQCGSFNRGPVRWLTEWNFAGATPPTVSRKTDPPEDLDKQADRDTKLYNMGWRPTEQHIQDVYGDGYERRTDQIAPGNETGAAELSDAPSADFAEGAPYSAVDQFLGSEDHYVALGGEMDGLIGELEDMIARADGLEDAKARLAQFAALPDDDPFADRLARSGFNARLHGRTVTEPIEEP